jgi:PAS domain S-box-containing protein
MESKMTDEKQRRVDQPEEQLQAIAALRESEHRFRKIFEHANDAVFIVDPRHDRILDVNPSSCRMLGYSREELLALPVTAIHCHELPLLSRFTEAVHNQGAAWTDELTCLTKAGSPLAVEISASVFELDGQPCLITMVRDVSERRRAEGALRQARDDLERRVAERTRELLDANARLREEIGDRRRAEEQLRRYAERLETSTAIVRAILAARSPEAIAEAALARIRELVPCMRASVLLRDPERDEAVTLAVNICGETHVTPGTRFPWHALAFSGESGGGVRIVDDVAATPGSTAMERLRQEGLRSFMAVPLVTGDEMVGSLNLGSDRPAAFAAEHVDIAREVADSLAVGIRQARLLARIERHAAELERRVAERTAELEAFSYSVSHDLRTPLRTIDGFARILVEDHAAALDAESLRLLNTICASTEMMGRLIDGLLAVSRIDRQEMHLAVVDMEEAARSAWAELIANRPAAPRLDLRPMAPARGDAALVRQVFINLLSNAIKFTCDREVSVVEVGGAPGQAEHVYYVRDSGVGFDMRYAEKLFGVFQRLHPADEFEGTGVGLAIVRRVIQRHGGRTWATAGVGEGATFSFTLPAAEDSSW